MRVGSGAEILDEQMRVRSQGDANIAVPHEPLHAVRVHSAAEQPLSCRRAAATFACGAAPARRGPPAWASPHALPVAALRATGFALVLIAVSTWSISRRIQLLWSEGALLGVLDGAYALGSIAALAAFCAAMTLELRFVLAASAALVAIFAAVELSCALSLRTSGSGYSSTRSSPS